MEIYGTEVPINVTFLLRDAKAARDNGNLALMERKIGKMHAAGLPEDVAAELERKARTAPYNPQPTREISGCVIPPTTRTYNAKVVPNPTSKGWERLHEAVMAGEFTEDEAVPLAAHLIARDKAIREEQIAARKALLARQILAV